MSTKRLRRFATGLYIGILLIYVLAGVTLVPFHGDESTIIEMSRDWYRLVVDHDLNAVLYNPTPPDTAFQGDQELRLLNGVLSKYGIGLMASFLGIPAHKLNTRWIWGEDWYVNQYYGHIPVNPLLFIARMSSALMTLISVALVYRIGRMLGGTSTALLISFIYVTLPVLLINGRRTMFEGAFLLATAFLILVALSLTRHLQRNQFAIQQIRWTYWIVFGIALGLAPAAKHTAILPAIPIVLVLLWLGRRQLIKMTQQLAVSILIAVATFFMLNPAWWSHPLQTPQAVLKLRQELLNQQLAFFDVYTNSSDRISAIVGYTFGGPQYFEEHFNGPQGWQDWLKDQIEQYDRSPLAGIHWGRLGIVLWAFILFGILAMIRTILLQPNQQQSAASLVFIAITLFSILAIFILTPLAWQRYYLPLAIPLSGALSMGTVTVVNRIVLLTNSARKALPAPQ